MTRFRFALMLAVLAVLEPLGVAVAAPAPVVPATGGAPTTVSQDCANTVELQFLSLINTYRAQHGLTKLVLGQHLDAAAQHHALDLATRNYFSHYTLGTNASPKDRLIAHGYPAGSTYWGENIYAGYGTVNGVDQASAQAAFTWWKNSPGHNANMLNPNFRAIGIDRQYNANSTYKYYWVTDFGGLVDNLSATLC